MSEGERTNNKAEIQDDGDNPWILVAVWRAMYTFFVTKGYSVELTEEMKKAREEIFGW